MNLPALEFLLNDSGAAGSQSSAAMLVLLRITLHMQDLTAFSAPKRELRSFARLAKVPEFVR
jgi:hypothetical protein